MYVYIFNLAICSETPRATNIALHNSNLQSITSLFAVEHGLQLYP